MAEWIVFDRATGKAKPMTQPPDGSTNAMSFERLAALLDKEEATRNERVSHITFGATRIYITFEERKPDAKD